MLKRRTLRADFTTAHGRIQIVNASPSQVLCYGLHGRAAHGAHANDGAAGFEGAGGVARLEQYAAHLGIVHHHADEDIGIARGILCAECGLHTFFDHGLQCIGVYIECAHGVAGTRQVNRHWAAHDAQANEGDGGVSSLRSYTPNGRGDESNVNCPCRSTFDAVAISLEQPCQIPAQCLCHSSLGPMWQVCADDVGRQVLPKPRGRGQMHRRPNA